MKELLRNRFTVLIISGLLVSLGLLFVGYSWSLGFLLGFAFSFLTVNITKYQVDSVLFSRTQSWTTYVKFMLGNLIYIVPFIISILLYDWFNLFAVGIGLLYFKYFIFISEIFFRQKENK
jgi:hypothetical protein